MLRWPSRAETTCGGCPKLPASVAHVRRNACGDTPNPNRSSSSRVRWPRRGCPVVSLLDTGVQSRHPLLVGASPAKRRFTAEPFWGIEDHHGPHSDVEPYQVGYYTDRNAPFGIQAPAQALNALSVGAVTLKAARTPGQKAVAAVGDLSPTSRTAQSWSKLHAHKPDIVMDGQLPHRRGPCLLPLVASASRPNDRAIRIARQAFPGRRDERRPLQPARAWLAAYSHDIRISAWKPSER
jgi:hypothetical protein